MSIASLGKRVDRVGPASAGFLSVAKTLDTVRAQEIERRERWEAAGNTGRPPPEPRMVLEPLPFKATRADATLWRKQTHGRARVATTGAARHRPSVTSSTSTPCQRPI